MTKILILMTGGAIGTFLRYSASGLVHKHIKTIFPFGTMAVNLTGALVIGFLWGLLDIEEMHTNVKNFLFIGILGGFTTFSSFALESMNLFRDGEVKFAIINILVSNLAGIVLVFLGFFLAKYLINLVR